MPKKTKKREVQGSLKVDVYAVLDRAVEEGLAYGWRRAHKHVDNPSEDAIREAMQNAVMDAICGVFKFDDNSEG